MNSIKVIATDKQGNEFVKEVKPLQGTGFHEGMLILDFGWPVQYVADSIKRYYPFQKPMCIDIGGRNHKGSQVEISADQMDRVLEHFEVV